jgi:glycosyltransferase involved in cell wall biosynthesis
MLKVLVLTRYDRLGSSSRVRFLQFLPKLVERGFAFDVLPLLSNDYIEAIYSQEAIYDGETIDSAEGSHSAAVGAAYFRRLSKLLRRRNYDLIWLEKEALPWVPAGIEAFLLRGVPYVVDLDDAWFIRYGTHPSAATRRLLGGKIEAIARRSSLVVAGNNYLGARAREVGARRVEVIPSSIDLTRYPAEPAALPALKSDPAEPVIIGWIGTPHTVGYLSKIEPALREVLSAGGAKLHVIGASVPANLADLPSASFAWSESTEVEAITRFDIGIMPLLDGEWEKGKCGYKLLQAMAAARPVIASAVGANTDIIQDGVNGLLVSVPLQWVAAMKCLIDDPALRHRLGLAGRRTVEHRYSLAANFSRLASALTEAARPVKDVTKTGKIPWLSKSQS